MRWTGRTGREGLAAVAVVLALGCGGEDGGPAGNAGSIQVAVTPAAVVASQGGTGSVTASLTRGGGFSGVVTLAVSGLPAGVTATITPAQLSGTTLSATIDVAVPTSVAPGAYTATVTATAPGVGEATTTCQLTVTPAPDYTLTVAPPAITSAAGGSAGATINIDRTNFTGGVALALQNPPAGIAGAFNPTPSTTNASTLLVSVPASVAPGSYPLTIRGTATGVGDRTASLQLTVTAPPTGGNVEFQFCDASEVPVFFAYQDGSGAWQAVTGTTASGVTRFAFTLAQGRGGVLAVYRESSAMVADALATGRIAHARRVATRLSGARGRLRSPSRPAGRTPTGALVADEYTTEVLYASTAELAQDGAGPCVPSQETKTLTGTVAGVAAGQYGIASIGSTTEVFNGATSTNPVTFTDVPPGPVDLVGSRITKPGTPPDKLVVFRNLNVPDGGALPATIDYDGPASSTPATASATTTGSAGDNLEIFTEVVTANSHSLLWFDLAPSLASTRPWAGLAPGVMASGDFHGLVVFATPPGGAATGFRVALKYVGAVANHTLALGPIIGATTVTQVAAGPYPRFRFQGPIPVEYNRGASIDLASTLDEGNAFGIIATGAWLAGSGNALGYDFTMPDVSGLPGFPVEARLSAGMNDVSASSFGFTGTGIFDLKPGVGGEFRSAMRRSAISVP